MSTVERPLRRDAERNRQRILEAARELFTERGLGVTLNDIARHAGCGVGTVYRRFPDKELLIDALFEERIGRLVEIARDSLTIEDPWQGLTAFMEKGLEAMAGDRGLKELLLSSDQGCSRERIAAARERLQPMIDALVARAHASGALRQDIEPRDMPILQVMFGAVIDASQDVEPQLWRRYLEIVMRGLRAEPTNPGPLPVGALDDESLEVVLSSVRPPLRR